MNTKPMPTIPGIDVRKSSLRPTSLLAGFFTLGLVFLLAGAATAIIGTLTDYVWARWLALHLVLLGGVSQLILGAGQFFAAAFLATDPPPKRLILAQGIVWNIGVLMVATGVPLGYPELAETGGVFIVGGLGLFGAGLLTMKGRSLQQMSWAVRWYLSAAAFLAVGALVGAGLAGGVSWSSGSLLGTHLALNLAGWLGATIIGTLHTFFPSLTGTQLAHPLLERYTFVGWLTGVTALAVGLAFDSAAAVALGWIALLLAAALLGLNLLTCLRNANEVLPFSIRLIGLGQLFLVAGLMFGLISTLDNGTTGAFTEPARTALATLLIGGWIGLTVAGSLLHLLGILTRIRTRFGFKIPAPEPLQDRLLTLLAGLGLAGMTLAGVSGLNGLNTPARTLTIAVLAMIAWRILGMATRAGFGVKGLPWERES